MEYKEIISRFKDCPSAIELASIEKEKKDLLNRYNALDRKKENLFQS